MALRSASGVCSRSPLSHQAEMISPFHKADVMARPATPAEERRAAYLFRNEDEKPPASARFFVAVRATPVERFVAAAAVWRGKDSTHFLLARQPGMDGPSAADVLIPALEHSGARKLRYGRLLAEDEAWVTDLERHGFQRTDKERVFQVSFATLWHRVDHMLRRNASAFPGTWRLVPITGCGPETVWPLVAAFRLISFEDLRRFWQTPSPLGYARDWSVVLFDGSEAIGALLVRRTDRCAAADIRAVKAIPARQRALANLALLSFGHRQTHPDSIRTAVFRANGTAHRETANLARRLGGTDVRVRYSFLKT